MEMFAFLSKSTSAMQPAVVCTAFAWLAVNVNAQQVNELFFQTRCKYHGLLCIDYHVAVICI